MPEPIAAVARLLLLAVGLGYGRCDYVSEVEVNTFGDQPRTAIIYRDADHSIRDWRWLTCQEQIPQRDQDGKYTAIWKDAGSIRIVKCQSIRWTRTREDVELTERWRLPDAKRRKLSR